MFSNHKHAFLIVTLKLICKILEESPISIVVEGTTVEATDVDSVPDLMVPKYNKTASQSSDSSEQSVVKRRQGGATGKSRPISDGHILSQQYSDGKVR